MLKQKLIKASLPYIVVFIGLFLAGLVSFLLVSNAESGKAESSEEKVQGTATTNLLAPTQQPTVPVETKPVIKKVASLNQPQPTPKPTSSSSPITIAQNNTPVTSQVTTPSPTPSNGHQTDQVTVSINGSSNFTISVSDGANQCDVLNKALADGKISSLNMRYDSSFGTYAVYQINGIGKDNSVWWTYTVNGQSPGQGCSYIKVKNNDNIEWKYIGS